MSRDPSLFRWQSDYTLPLEREIKDSSILYTLSSKVLMKEGDLRLGMKKEIRLGNHSGNRCCLLPSLAREWYDSETLSQWNWFHTFCSTNTRTRELVPRSDWKFPSKSHRTWESRHSKTETTSLLVIDASSGNSSNCHNSCPFPDQQSLGCQDVSCMYVYPDCFVVVSISCCCRETENEDQLTVKGK